MNLAMNIERLSPKATAALCAAGVALVGVIDYLTGPDLLCSVFYLMPVALGTWRLGRSFGVFVSVLSVLAWIASDLAAGAHFRSPFVPIWNAAILLMFYGVVVWLLANLRDLQADLAAKVRERTRALTQEMAERERLEHEILEISETERRRIGDDIHDTLCQHLTATALAGQVLSEKLARKDTPEAADARHIANLIERGIGMARNLARGLQPVQVDVEGLMDAFANLAAVTTRASKVECSFECEAPALIENAVTATNLYRIGQEAVTNALRHGKPERISITLAQDNGTLMLTVEDDGAGLAEDWDKQDGMGTRIMAHRAAMIGAKLNIEPNPTGGTMVTCTLKTNV